MLFSAYEVTYSSFIHLAVALYVIGFLLRNQIALRLIILSGTTLYIAYYYTVEGGPLWDALIGSCLIGGANLIGLISLISSRLQFGMAARQRSLLAALGEMEPGVFRAIMRLAQDRISDGVTPLTREGETPKALHFVLTERPVVTKGAQNFQVEGGCFIGEVSWMLGVPASATVTLPAGAQYIEWPRDRLMRLTRRRHRVRVALDALIARDMARKVAAAHRPDLTDIQTLRHQRGDPAP